MAPPATNRHPHRAPERRVPRAALVAVWLLLVGGIVASVAGAGAWRAYVAKRASLEATDTASQLSGTLATALRRDADLAATTRTLIQTEPAITNAQFAAWFQTLGWNQRYPEVQGFGFLQPVTAAQLPAFVASFQADPTSALAAPFTITPPGKRPFYCLGRIGASAYGATNPIPANFDACAIPQYATYLWMAADSTRLVALPYGNNGFVMVEPIYRTGSLPPPGPARRAELAGWTGGIFDAGKILDAATGGQSGLSGRLLRVNPSGQQILIATFGRARKGPVLNRTVPIEADGGWVVDLAVPPAYGWFGPGTQGLIGLLVGVILTAVLFVSARLLLSSRGRALRLVDERTGELRHQALHDILTGLPNRALILDRLEQMLARARREHSAVAALFIDVDNFKDINDTLGHPVGDTLLRAVATRLSTALRESDTVGRLGGDEFVVLVEGASLYAGPEVVAQRLLDVLREPFDLGDDVRPYLVTASIGIASGERSSADDMLRDADVALYRAKAAGKGCYVLFQPEMQTEIHDRLQLEMELRDAVSDGQLFLLYQPTFDLTTVTVTGVEALVRWQHPRRGIISPSDFIPLAEETGAILDIGRWVLREATRQGAAWHAAGERVTVAVNISVRQLDSAELIHDLRVALAESGFDPGWLVLEITETTIMRDADLTARTLRELKALGVRIAIDDFGTGYSSLAYLEQFPVDALKIDRSFISGIASSSEAGALIHTLVQLGKTLGLETLAEGIEEPHQFERLQVEQCDSGQGFLFARPLPADVVAGFIRSWPRAVPEATAT